MVQRTAARSGCGGRQPAEGRRGPANPRRSLRSSAAATPMHRDYPGTGGAVHYFRNDVTHAFPRLSRPAGAREWFSVGAISRNLVSLWLEGRENASLSQAHAGSLRESQAPIRGTFATRRFLWGVASDGQTPARKRRGVGKGAIRGASPRRSRAL